MKTLKKFYVMCLLYSPIIKTETVAFLLNNFKKISKKKLEQKTFSFTRINDLCFLFFESF